MSPQLIERREAGIATLTLNRPEARNALTGEMLGALLEAVRRLAADPEVRALVLTGAEGAFCAGGDVKGFVAAQAPGRPAATFETKVAGLRETMEISRWLHEMPKPTLAVIPGAAAGAGLALALACDLRIAATEARLTTAFAKVGVSGDFGGSYFLTQLVGPALARKLYFNAEVLSGDDAGRLGLVDEVVPRSELEAVAKAYAARLAALPTVAIGYMKANLNRAMHGGLADVLDSEAIHMVRTMMTDDHKDASRAFVEKRPPVFAGR